MTTAPSSKPGQAAFTLDPKVAKAFLSFSGGFWRGETARNAWLLTLGLATCLIASVGATAALNWWNRLFFDALERRDAETAGIAVLAFLAIIAVMAAIGVGIVLTRETLQVRWRAWLVGRLVERWVGNARFYHLNVLGTEPANPEYRIADDSRWATEPLTDLAIGLLSAVVGAATFISILWVVGGSYTLHVFGTSVTIPAYMVVVSLAYGAIASGLMLLVGRPLVGYVGQKNAAEGYFRFALTRLRENGESVALMRGGPSERAILGEAYGTVVQRWLSIVRRHGHLTWITNSSGPMIPIVPLLFAAPKYLAGEMSLGQVTQLAAAFVQVQIAISWIVDNYNRIAEWYASARRVMDVVDACDHADDKLAAEGERGIQIAIGRDGALGAEALVVRDGSGAPLVARADFAVDRGGLLHVGADSSVGKTSLVRALAGLWPWGSGTIQQGDGARVMVVPQKAYLPLGSLRRALLYPQLDAEHDEATLQTALSAAGLAHLGDRLDEDVRWDQVLSSGERQRLAIARLLVSKPDVVILDDALSGLEAGAQRALLETLRRSLPRAAIVSFGQRQAADGGEARQVVMQRGVDGAVLDGRVAVAATA
jgi:putative ATP-binding cassette transporter